MYDQNENNTERTDAFQDIHNQTDAEDAGNTEQSTDSGAYGSQSGSPNNGNVYDSQSGDGGMHSGQNGGAYGSPNSGNTYGSPNNANNNRGGQYNPGWQRGYYYPNDYKQPATPPQQQYYNTKQEYRWDRDSYSNVGGVTPKPRKNGGLRVFAGLAAAAFAIVTIYFAGVGVMTIGTNLNFSEWWSSSSQTANSTETAPVSPDGATGANISSGEGINLSDKPSSVSKINLGDRLTVEEIVENVIPTVVGIMSYSNTNTRFGSFSTSSGGTGIILTSDGYIVTNAHVVADTVGVKVVLSNSEEYEATVVGSDTQTDLAVLKINANNLQAATFGNSEQAKLGETVIAIGNTTGKLDTSCVTQGIISLLNREVPIGSYSVKFLQTDAAINPGNSGGPLLNMYGQVIGINSAKFVAAEYEGIGFAIPINDAKPVIDSLKESGKVLGRPKLGVLVSDVDETSAKLDAVPVGVMIMGVLRGSSAERNGLQVGDIITKMNDVRISSSNVLFDELKRYAPDDKVKVTVFRRPRSGPDETLEVEIILFEDTDGRAADTRNYNQMP